MNDDTPTPELPSARSTWPRRLHIAISVFFALLAVAFVVLWVRSYWWLDVITIPMRIASVRGNLFVNQTLDVPEGITHEVVRGNLVSMPLLSRKVVRIGLPGHSIHYCAIVAAVSAIGASPWIWNGKLRYSLRALLIVTTLTALVLGLAAWVTR